MTAADNQDLTTFLAAAGLVAHYVGDASQPLHGSYLSNGMPDGTGTGVHSAYEDTMVDLHDTDILAGITAALGALTPPAKVTTGHDAAVAVVALMDRTAKRIDPTTLVQTYAKTATHANDSSVAVTNALWEQFGQAIIDCLADGTLTLAMIWTSAWTAGHGTRHFRAPTAMPAIDPAALQASTRKRPSSHP